MRYIISILLAISSIVGYAQQISPEKAQAIASEFLNSAVTPAMKISPGEILSSRAADIPTASQQYYIFNAENGGGFVIVSGDERTKSILGYSHEGHIDVDNMPPQLEYLLESYSKSIQNLGKCTPILPKSNGKSVGPLIKSEWGQNSPYNNLLPIIYDDVRAVTGCTNTSQAQIMRYYRWPAEHGNGVIGYTSDNGDEYSVDLSKSKYDWDNMLDKYDYNDSENPISSRNEDAVALLFRDIAYSNRTSFGNESGAAHNYEALVENFGYDKGIRVVDYYHWTLEEYEAILRKELDEGRPVIIAGAPGNGSSAHDFICDGYDDKGYFHYNYGWDGNTDGYFLSTATGFDLSHSATIGIQPECGGKIINFAYSDADFEFYENSIKCSLFYENVFRHPVEPEVATVCENVSTGEKTYLPGPITQLPLPEAISDGEYILYPAIKFNDGEWEKFRFAQNRQSYIDLSVVDGIKKYANNHITDYLDEGKVEVDGVYYILHEDNTAEVTFRNDRYNSYSGDVTIPESIDVDGTTFDVTIIGNNAFRESKIQTLHLPKSLKKLKAGFFICKIGKIIFEEPSELKQLEGWAFNAFDVNEIRLPEGIETIGTCAFQAFKGTLIEIPGSVTYFGRYPFTANNKLRSVIVHWEKEADLPTIQPDYHLFDQCNWNEITLYVPDGCKDIYEKAPQWSDLNIREMSVYLDSKVTFDITAVEIFENETQQLIATITPDDAPANSVIWTSNNPEIASVDENGLVTAILPGKALITATIPNGLEASCEITVVSKPVYIEVCLVSLDHQELQLNEDDILQLIATVAPDNATDQTVTWTTSDAAVATVDASGVVTAIKAGTATITASTANGLTATCTVTVTAKVSGIEGVEDDGAKVSVEGGDIVVSGGERAEVYSITGIRVAVVSDGRVTGLPRGIYLVRLNGKTVKIRL